MADRNNHGSGGDEPGQNLEKLHDKLSQARRESVLLSRRAKESDDATSPEDRSRGSAMGIAFRISTDLVAAVLVGGVIGYSLDEWLGTDPFLLLVMLFIGIAAGFVNVIRSAREMNRAPTDSSDNEPEGR